MVRFLFAAGLMALFGLADPAQAQFAPPQPILQFVGTETYQANGKVWTRYNLAIQNRAAFPDQMFQWIGGGANPARTHVIIRDEGGRQLYGFTALRSSQ